MARQFHRSWSLSDISGGTPGNTIVSGKGLDGLDVTFQVETHTLQEPDAAEICLYNLNPSTIAAIQSAKSVLLSAGYEGSEGEIYRGEVVEFQTGEKADNNTAVLTRVWCATKNRAYNHAKLNQTLAAGASHQDIVNACAQVLAQYGVGATAAGIQRYLFAMKQAGVDEGEANAALEGFSRTIKSNPDGYKGLLESWNVKTKNADGSDRSMEEMLADLGRNRFALEPYSQARLEADRLGIGGDNALNALRNPNALRQGYGAYDAKLQAFGLDPNKAAEDARKVQRAYDNLDADLKIVRTKVEADFFVPMMDAFEGIAKWMEAHPDVTNNFEKGLVGFAGVMSLRVIPPLVKLLGTLTGLSTLTLPAWLLAGAGLVATTSPLNAGEPQIDPQGRLHYPDGHTEQGKVWDGKSAAPAPPADDRNWWQRNAPSWLGGRPAPSVHGASVADRRARGGNDGAVIGPGDGTATTQDSGVGFTSGMRARNLGNIGYFGQHTPGLLGPSNSRDVDHSIGLFATQEDGIRAAASLALHKYRSGMTSTSSLIAGPRGWTPGALGPGASVNIARAMGLSNTDDLHLDNPEMMRKFLHGLAIQEHGKAGAFYTPQMIESALSGRNTPPPLVPKQAGHPFSSSFPAGQMIPDGNTLGQLKRDKFDNYLRQHADEAARLGLSPPGTPLKVDVVKSIDHERMMDFHRKLAQWTKDGKLDAAHLMRLNPHSLTAAAFHHFNNSRTHNERHGDTFHVHGTDTQSALNHAVKVSARRSAEDRVRNGQG